MKPRQELDYLRNKIQEMERAHSVKVSTYEKKIDELNDRLNWYKSKEEHIVSALTDAQQSAKETIDQANFDAESIIAKAEQEQRRINEVTSELRAESKQSIKQMVSDDIASITQSFNTIEKKGEECVETVELSRQTIEQMKEVAQQKFDEFAQSMNQMISMLEGDVMQSAKMVASAKTNLQIDDTIDKLMKDTGIDRLDEPKENDDIPDEQAEVITVDEVVAGVDEQSVNTDEALMKEIEKAVDSLPLE